VSGEVAWEHVDIARPLICTLIDTVIANDGHRNAAGQPVMSGSYGGGMDSATRDRATDRTTQNARANGFSAITYVGA